MRYGKVRLQVCHLKSWGRDAYVKHAQADKLKTRSIKYKFVGYPKETLGYYFYNPKEQKVFVSKQVIFLEKVSIRKTKWE